MIKTLGSFILFPTEVLRYVVFTVVDYCRSRWILDILSKNFSFLTVYYILPAGHCKRMLFFTFNVAYVCNPTVREISHCIFLY